VLVLTTPLQTPIWALALSIFIAMVRCSGAHSLAELTIGVPCTVRPASSRRAEVLTPRAGIIAAVSNTFIGLNVLTEL